MDDYSISKLLRYESQKFNQYMPNIITNIAYLIHAQISFAIAQHIMPMSVLINFMKGNIKYIGIDYKLIFLFILFLNAAENITVPLPRHINENISENDLAATPMIFFDRSQRVLKLLPFESYHWQTFDRNKLMICLTLIIIYSF